jgi:ABC-type antimicrobial peptide transport system permease subunit
MSLKDLVVKTNDILCYIAFAAVGLIAVGAIIGGSVGAGLLFALIGWLVCSLVFGFWLAVSNISANATKQTETLVMQLALLEKQNKLIEKLYQSSEANNFNSLE